MIEILPFLSIMRIRYTDTLELLPVEKTYQSGGNTESSVENKTITWSTRFNVGDANFDIRSIGLYKTYLVTLPEPSVFEKYTLNDVDIGIGDGETADSRSYCTVQFICKN